MKTLLAVGFGGAIGSMLRVIVSRLFPLFVFGSFPLPILAINVVGCFVMGSVTEWLAFRGAFSEPIRAFMTTGILGGFTTFSAFSLEFGLLAEKNMTGMAFLYVAITVIATLSAFFLGMKFVRLVL